MWSIIELTELAIIVPKQEFTWASESATNQVRKFKKSVKLFTWPSCANLLKINYYSWEDTHESFLWEFDISSKILNSWTQSPSMSLSFNLLSCFKMLLLPEKLNAFRSQDLLQYSIPRKETLKLSLDFIIRKVTLVSKFINWQMISKVFTTSDVYSISSALWIQNALLMPLICRIVL